MAHADPLGTVFQGKDGYWYYETLDPSGNVITKEQFYDQGMTQPTGWSATCQQP